MSQDITKRPRLYTDQGLSEKDSVELLPTQAHYLKNVMREQEGTVIRLFNGRDGEWNGVIHELSKKSCIISLTHQIKQQPEKRKSVSLIFAPIKKHRMDFLIEKAVELGVTDFYPVLTHHTEVRKINTERLNSQILEAAEQCERLDIPKLHDIQNLYAALQNFGSPIFAALERGDYPLINTLNLSSDCAFLVGPVGGFSDDEFEKIPKFLNITPISLGDQVLRVETAVVKILSFT